MPTLTQDTVQVCDYDLGKTPQVSVERGDKMLEFAWPCGAVRRIKRADLQTILQAFDEMPKRRNSIRYAVMAPNVVTSRYGDEYDLLLHAEGRYRVRAITTGDDSGWFSLKELRKVAGLE